MSNAVRLPERLCEAHAAILGLGLMGGSLALALRGSCARLLGFDPDREALALAAASGMLDQVSDDLAEILSQANLIVLAAPVRAILALLDQLPGLHPGPAIVIDLGSTKVEITRAMDKLPPRFEALGGHPICGKETSGLGAAAASIFRSAPFALIGLARTSPATRRLAEELVQAIGSVPVWLDAHTHDRYVASISHLPYLLAIALVLTTAPETAGLAGPGFRSASRLAGSNPTMMLDVLGTNREHVGQALEHYRRQIEQLEQHLRDPQDHGLRSRLEQGQRGYARLRSMQQSAEAP